jgi:AraC-like DNA-binding protein
MLAVYDIALRAASVALLLMLAASLYRDAKSAVSGRLAAAFALGSAAHAATSTIGPVAPVAIWHAPLIALSTGNVVVFWLFCRALFDDAFALRWWHGLIWAAVAGFSFSNCLWLAPAGFTRLAVVTTNLLALGFIGLAVGQTIASWSNDLVEGRRSLRIFIVAGAALYGGMNAILQIAALGSDAAGLANVANAALLTGIVVAISFAMMRVDGGDVFAVMHNPVASVPSQRAAAPVAGDADQKLIDALMRLMADERIYRQDNVTIATLATKLKIPEYRLRRLINQRLGYRNFNVFLNNHRIEEAKAALADPTQAEVPVITIAMDAGFQSLGPFNRAFKATTGVTPSEYRRLKHSVA